MPKDGTVTINVFYESTGIKVTITDTGVGIPVEIKPKLFQPLMTTKARG